MARSAAIGDGHLYWKLGEEERHFNTIQAGLRALASAWLLATFGAVAVLLERSKDDAFWIPAEWLVAVVCLMGATGLTLLWTIDQLVYHRLLNAVFLVGLKLEYDDPRIPPVRASMMVASGNRGMARLLAFFYAVPVAALAVTASGVTAYHAADVEVSSTGGAARLAGLFAVALSPVILLVLMRRLGPEVRFADRARTFEDPGFARVVEEARYAEIVARYSGSGAAGGSQGVTAAGPSVR